MENCLCHFAENTNCIKDVFVPIMTLLVSVFAILLAVWSFKSQHKYYRKSIMPIGQILFFDGLNYIKVYIKNKGLGPLVIKKFRVIKNSFKEAKSLIEYFEKDDILWSNFYGNPEDYVMSPNEELVLLEWSMPELPTDASEEDKQKYIKEGEIIKNMLRDMEIEFSYEDIFEKEKHKEKRSLSWFGRTL